MSTNDEYHGGCLCGAVRYEVRGEPVSTNLCFCTQCQRHTGSPMPAFATFERERLRILQGEPVTYRSSARAVRQFCGRCGSALFWQEDGGDTIDVFLGTVDERTRVRAPDFAIWAEHRVGWLPQVETIPTYAGRRNSDGTDSSTSA